MVKPIKNKKIKPRYFIEVARGGVVTTGYCYRVIRKDADGDDDDDDEVVKDWYGDYPTQKHANDAGRRWVFKYYKEKS